MSDEADVTFVGGHVTEQHDGGEEPTGDRAEELAAAKAAVKEAIEKAGKDGAEEGKRASRKDPFSAKPKDKDGDDEAPASKPAKPKDEEDADKAKLSRILAKRSEMAKAKQQQAQELQQARFQMQQAYAQLQREKAAIEAERARIQRLRSDPAAAIKENGWAPEEFILSLAKEGTEEGKVARMLREQQQQLAEMKSWQENLLRQREEHQRQLQQQQVIQKRQSVEQEFLGHAMNEEKHPHMTAFYKGREGTLIAEGDYVAAKYRELTGEEASLADIAEYIEEQLAERARSWYEKSAGGKAPQQRTQQVAPPKTGKPARGASGKTLTASGTSERRALGKDLQDLDGEERILAAREAVKAAMASARDD